MKYLSRLATLGNNAGGANGLRYYKMGVYFIIFHFKFGIFSSPKYQYV